MEIRKTLILSVTSVKGGTGKSINVLNLAGIYQRMKKKVLIIDLDLYSGDIAALLNLENEKDIYNLFEDITNNKFHSLQDYITSYNEFIDVLCAPRDPRFANKVNGQLINFVLSKASFCYDVIIIDTNHFLNSINLTAFDRSTEILYVLNNDLMNLKSMKTMTAIFYNMGKKNYKILLYEAKDKKKKLFSDMDIRNVIKQDIDYKIASTFYLKNINDYIMKGKIITLTSVMDSHSKTLKIYEDMAISFMKQVNYNE